MCDWRRLLGIALGLVLAALLLPLAGGGGAAMLPSRLTSECDGALHALVLHYVPDAEPIVAAVYRGFLRQLPPDVTVYVLCPDQSVFDALVANVQPVRCGLVPVETGHPLTCWSRDRWLALSPSSPAGPVTLLTPRGEAGALTWPARAGDERAAEDLAAARPREVSAHRSLLFFDAGDFIADAETVFVTPAVARRNLQHTVASIDELRACLAAKIKQRIVLLDEAPDHHAGMFMALAGGRTAVVGDPSLARRILDAAGAGDRACCGGVGDDFRAATQALFDAVAAQCGRAGYRVVRIPVVPGMDGRTYVTYVNGILDARNPQRVFYMPEYSHVPELNRAAAAVWRSLGFAVRFVDCSLVYTHFGTLHCLINVLRRK